MLLGHTPSSAAVWRVHADGSGDAVTIQAAHDSAAAFDTLLVTPGTYYESVVLTTPVILISEHGRETAAIDGSSAARVLRVAPSASGTLIAHLTIQNGHAPMDGGGVLIEATGTVVRDCIVRNNKTAAFDLGNGGGICIAWSTADCTIEDCLVESNVAGDSGGGIAGAGLIRRNVVLGNYCHVSGGGLQGGGIITENIFAHNISDNNAGGVRVAGEFRNNTVVDNITFNNELTPGVAAGGSAVLRNNIVARNVHMFGLPTASAIAWSFPAIVTAACNDVWGNANDYISPGPGITLADNFSADPLFCDSDYNISWFSPCASGPFGQIGARSGMCFLTSVRPATWTSLKSMYR